VARPLTGLDLLDATAGPGASEAIYRRAREELAAIADALPGTGELSPQEATLRHDLAALALLTGDRAAHDRELGSMRARSAPAGVVAWTSVLAPNGFDPARAVALADRAIRDGSTSDAWRYVARAAALMRAARHEEALAALDSADRLGPKSPSRALNDLIRAHVRIRQGQAGAARQLLASALLQAGRPPDGPARAGRILQGAPIQDVLTFEVLRREVEALLPDAGFPADPFAR
jgi:tetratricopeptide (TPR) repeat protein